MQEQLTTTVRLLVQNKPCREPHHIGQLGHFLSVDVGICRTHVSTYVLTDIKPDMQCD